MAIGTQEMSAMCISLHAATVVAAIRFGYGDHLLRKERRSLTAGRSNDGGDRARSPREISEGVP